MVGKNDSGESWIQRVSPSLRKEKQEIEKRYGIRIGQTEIYCARCDRPWGFGGKEEGMKILFNPKEQSLLGANLKTAFAYTTRLLNRYPEALLFSGDEVEEIVFCPECTGGFLRTNEKQKIYCSPKCAWKLLSRARRAELKRHPRVYQAFLKKQREVKRAEYAKKKEARNGNFSSSKGERPEWRRG